MIVAGLVFLSLILSAASVAVFLFGANVLDQDQTMDALHDFYEERVLR